MESPQVNLVEHGTRPDLYATRVDAAGTPPIAIYLDGWEYHGNNPDQVDLDRWLDDGGLSLPDD